MPTAAGPNIRPAEITAEEISASPHMTTGENPPSKVNAATPSLKNNTPGKDALFDPYCQIPAYIHQGLTAAEVAARLDLPEAAVDLYVNLRMSPAKDGSQKTA
jgi:DNA-binding NarL/FixJ family response regulator